MADFGTTTRRALPYPEQSAPRNVPRDIKALAQKVDDIASDFDPMTTTQRDALTGAALYDGRAIRNTTTGQLEVYLVAGGVGTWQPIASGAPAQVGIRMLGGRIAQFVETRADGSVTVGTCTYSADLLTKVDFTNPTRSITYSYASGQPTGWTVS